jgi:spermidine synthase
MHTAMRDAGFAQTRLLQIPQVIYPSGWWSASIAMKSRGELAQRLDERTIGKLRTEYYNAQIHRAAFAVPNFVKEALGS